MTIPSSAPAAPERAPLRGKGVFAVVLGNALEFYDFGVYAAFAVMIGHAFFPATDPYVSLLLSVATFGVGFVSRPLGGFLLGAYADRFGRKAAMTLTIALMGFSTAAIGLVPTYAQIGVAAPLLLVLARLLQGFSAGGELGASTVYLYEAAPAGRKGVFGSWQLASQGAASIFVGLLGFWIARAMSPEALNAWGWRIPFLAGLAIVPIGIYIRRNLDETLEAKVAHASTGGVFADLLRDHWGKLGLAVAAFAGITVTQYFLIYLTSFAINSLGMPASTALLANFAVGATTLVFAVVGGFLGDRYGLTAVTIAPRLPLLLALYPTILLLVNVPSAATLLGMAALLTALQAMSAALLVLVIARSFPRAIRTTGLATSLGIGAALFGGTAQVVFTWLIRVTDSPLSPVIYVMALNVVAILAIAVLSRAGEGDAPAAATLPAR